ncbi:MAG: hypothetical protein RMK84_05125 [Oscillochloridaceae bacterium]|nr:hypothetical protein [Chloroflexaceae bacterium]MDW8389485.1 hypothetical protein [Oscillochloridaceae bacterium]
MTVMTVPIVQQLRLENWRNLSASQRLDALQTMQRALALQEGREACRVDVLSRCEGLSPKDRERTYGLYIHENNTIYINDALIDPAQPHRFSYVDGTSVDPNTPYMATETLFHESRHAYQFHVATSPDTIEDAQRVRDWRMSLSGGYLTVKQFDYPFYRWQPMEADANDVARQRTEELFANQFQDKSFAYEHHRNQMEAEMANDIELGKRYVAEPPGAENYRERAREVMINHYNGMQRYRQQEGQSQEALQTGSFVEQGTTLTADAMNDSAEYKMASEIGGQTAEFSKTAGKETSGISSQQSEEGAQEAASEAPATSPTSQDATPKAEGAQEAASEAPATAAKEQGKDQDYGYGYGH